jgi:branched-subunit amino acid transport protein
MTPTPSLIFSILLLGTITYFYRFSFISIRGRKYAEKIPQNFLNLLAPATFSAIIANNILAHQNNPAELKTKIIVACFALIVARLTKNIVVTLLFGLGVLYILQHALN